jgi:tetratricopeptide (TPR) repeat protein
MLKKLIVKFGKVRLLLFLFGISLLLGFLTMLAYSKLNSDLNDFYSIEGFIFCTIGFIGLFLPIKITTLLYKKDLQEDKWKWQKRVAIGISILLSVFIFFSVLFILLFGMVIEPHKDLLYLGGKYYEEQDYDKAIQYFNEAIELKPHYAWVDEAYNVMGNAYEEKQAYDKALECYKKAIELNVRDKYYYANYANIASIYNNMGYAYAKKQDYDKAIESYKKSVELYPYYIDAYNNMGYAYTEKQDYDKAIEFYNKAIELYLAYPGAYNNMELTNVRDNIVRSYKRIIKLEPNFAEAYYYMKLAYEAKGDKEKALEYEIKMVELLRNDKK